MDRGRLLRPATLPDRMAVLVDRARAVTAAPVKEAPAGEKSSSAAVK